MCGIVGIFQIKEPSAELRQKALRMSQKIRHRGPDWSGIYCGGSAILAHERLSIVDPESGGQPLYAPDRKQVLAVNGEIYNHQDIRRKYAGKYAFQTGSDCEVILALYREMTHPSPLPEREGNDNFQTTDSAQALPLNTPLPLREGQEVGSLLEQLSGIFAFALYDEERDAFLIARDPIGVIPLYIGYDHEGKIYVASELKALEGQCDYYEPFPPGHYLWSGDLTSGFSPLTSIKRYYVRDWFDYSAVKDNPASVKAIHDALTDAVKRQLMSDVPYGVLLSGGLDSSVISAIAEKFSEHRIEDNSQSRAYWPRLHSFAVGLKGAPDLAKAKMVADHIGTVHHEINYTIQEGLDAIRDVIYFIETYDVTTVRASTPMYLLARVIKSMGIKMVLSGEGADEIFGGYLYFHKAPNAQAFHEETVRKLSKLYLYDCLRANKSLSAWGVEGRVPFLDKEFLDVAMRTNPEAKMCGKKQSGEPGFEIEKKIVREAFADMLPEEVAWRQKEQFSDGVGYSWIDTLKQITAEAVSDEQMAHAAERFPINPPRNKEEYYYRSIFAEHFPSDSAARSVPSEASVACSTAIALEWDAAFKNMNEPSGRAVKGVHEQAY
ncbi:MAG: asparagine synthase B [Prevotella sp.]|nr:asparagine synthase B [Prevotella sp.]